MVYLKVKNGEIIKKENENRSVKIYSKEIKRYKDRISFNKSVLKFNKNKIELVKTHLGNIRRLKDTEFFVVSDLSDALKLRDSYFICRKSNQKAFTKLSKETAREFGLTRGQLGFLLISRVRRIEYINKTRNEYNLDLERFLLELSCCVYGTK